MERREIQNEIERKIKGETPGIDQKLKTAVQWKASDSHIEMLCEYQHLQVFTTSYNLEVFTTVRSMLQTSINSIQTFNLKQQSKLH